MTPPLSKLAILQGHFRKEHPEPPARPAGRPKTRTDSHYAALLAEYSSMKDWFQASQGKPPKSDQDLLLTYFGACFQEQGLRLSRLTAPEFRSKIKTLRNELSSARRKLNARPGNSTITGIHADR